MRVEVYNAVSGSFQRRLVAEWEGSGIPVTSVGSVPDSAYRARRGVIRALSTRWRMYVGHSLRCWRAARRSRDPQTVRIVATNPFFAPALVARAAGGAGSTLNLLYDLYPEALVQAGLVGPDSWLARRCAAATRFALRECAATIYLGHRLRDYADARYGPARRSVVIPVGADGSPFRHRAPTPLPRTLAPRILYCGQMGAMHDSGTVSAVLLRRDRPRVEWAFHATGRGYARLRAAHGGRGDVAWGDALPDGEWPAAMTQAHVGLVTIARGAERVVMPSKAYSALVAGQAILAVCPGESDLADLVRRHECGWVVEPGDAEGLAAAIGAIAADPDGLWRRRRNAFEAGHRHYDMAPIASQWLALFHDLIPSAGSVRRESEAPSAP